jgi:hypothetical protein
MTIEAGGSAAGAPDGAASDTAKRNATAPRVSMRVARRIGPFRTVSARAAVQRTAHGLSIAKGLVAAVNGDVTTRYRDADDDGRSATL